MRKYFFYFFLFFLSIISVGQNRKIDSLWKVYNNKKAVDTMRLKAIHNIAWSYIYSSPDTAVMFAGKELELAQEKGKKNMPAEHITPWLFHLPYQGIIQSLWSII